jgi:hypothetical protein
MPEEPDAEKLAAAKKRVRISHLILAFNWKLMIDLVRAAQETESEESSY